MHRCLIEDNRIENAFFGIYLAGRSAVRSAQSAARAAAPRTVRQRHPSLDARATSTSRTIEITGHRDGIYLEFTHDTRVTRQRERAQSPLRNALHVLRRLPLRAQHVPRQRRRRGRHVHERVTWSTIDSRTTGAAPRTACCSRKSATLTCAQRFVRNTTALVADGATRLVADSNDFVENGWAVRLLASTQDVVHRQQLRRQHVRRRDEQPRNRRHRSAGTTGTRIAATILNRDGARRRALPSRAAVLAPRRAQRADADPAPKRRRELLDVAERVLPSLTPEMLADPAPRMRRLQ